MAGESGRRTLCGGCGAVLDERSGLAVEERRPCSSCGSLARRFELKVEGFVRPRSSLRLKARHAGQRRPFLEHFAGADFSTRLRRWMDKLRRIDRVGDLYDEVVTDPETGEVIHETHEPLSEHRGHGSVRPQAGSSGLSELNALLEDVAAKAQSVRPSSVEARSYPEFVALGLFVATFEVYLGIRALLRERLAEEARMLSRTLLDDTTLLLWFAAARNDPEELGARVLRHRFDSLEHEERFMQMARQTDHEWADEELAAIVEELEVVKMEADDRGITLKKLPDARGMLRAMGQESLYLWHVRASQSIHSSRIGFSARFRPGSDETEPIAIPLEGSVYDVVRVGVMAMQAFSLAMISAAELLGWDRRDELVGYRERLVRLSTELFDRVKRVMTSEEREVTGPAD